MQLRSHLIVALAASAALRPWQLSAPHALWVVALALGAAAAPDADHPASWIGRRLGALARLVHAAFGHRGATHSLAALALVALIGAWAERACGVRLTQAALCLGYGSHLAADFITRGGIALAWPLTRARMGLGLVRTGGALEPWACAAMSAACVAAAGAQPDWQHWGQVLVRHAQRMLA